MIIAARYGISGVPIAQLKLAKSLAKYGYNVKYIVGAVNDGINLPYCENFKILSLNKKRVIFMVPKLALEIFKFRPEIIFSAGDHLNIVTVLSALLALSKAKISCSSRVTPDDTYKNCYFPSRNFFIKLCIQLLSFRVAVFSCVSKAMVLQYKKYFKNSRHQCIYNIILNDDIEIRRKTPLADDWVNSLPSGVPLIVAAGNLEPWKGFEDLLRALCALKKKGVNFYAMILGDGSLRSHLERVIFQLNLVQNVKLIGNVSNPFNYFQRADIFALTSYVEGMPNVLIESMACGCTPVSTNCETGPGEIIVDGHNGYLSPVGDPEEFCACLEKAISAPIDESILMNSIREFSEKNILSKHFKLLDICD